LGFLGLVGVRFDREELRGKPRGNSAPQMAQEAAMVLARLGEKKTQREEFFKGGRHGKLDPLELGKTRNRVLEVPRTLSTIDRKGKKYREKADGSERELYSRILGVGRNCVVGKDQEGRQQRKKTPDQGKKIKKTERRKISR